MLDPTAQTQQIKLIITAQCTITEGNQLGLPTRAGVDITVVARPELCKPAETCL